jgi:hypothetical protein
VFIGKVLFGLTADFDILFLALCWNMFRLCRYMWLARRVSKHALFSCMGLGYDGVFFGCYRHG